MQKLASFGGENTSILKIASGQIPEIELNSDFLRMKEGITNLCDISAVSERFLFLERGEQHFQYKSKQLNLP
jgi:hypothetical protein